MGYDPGPHIPTDASGDAEQFCRKAIRCLEDWTPRAQAGQERIPRLVPWELRRPAQGLLYEAHRAGVRLWLGQALAAHVSVGTPADLRWWCELQYRALETLQHAYPAAFCRSYGFTLCDALLIDLAWPLLGDGEPSDREFWQQVLAEFTCRDPDRPPPGYLNPEGCQDLVSRAWGLVRELGSKMCCSALPEYPAKVVIGEHEARKALDRVFCWCNERDRLQAPGTAADDSAFRPASEFLLPDGFPSTMREIRRALKANPWIRCRRPVSKKTGQPIPNRLEIHAGEWFGYLAQRRRVGPDPHDLPAEKVEAMFREVERRTAEARQGRGT
jgi:hypothetical protein